MWRNRVPCFCVSCLFDERHIKKKLDNEPACARAVLLPCKQCTMLSPFMYWSPMMNRLWLLHFTMHRSLHYRTYTDDDDDEFDDAHVQWWWCVITLFFVFCTVNKLNIIFSHERCASCFLCTALAWSFNPCNCMMRCHFLMMGTRAMHRYSFLLYCTGNITPLFVALKGHHCQLDRLGIH